MECHSCKQAIGKNQPDIVYVRHEKPNTISVDDIRTQVNNDIVIKPYSSKRKIYIIDEVHQLRYAGANPIVLGHLLQIPAHIVPVMWLRCPRLHSLMEPTAS